MKNRTHHLFTLFVLLLAPISLSAQCDCYTTFVPCDEEIQYIDYAPWEAGDDAGLWCLPGSRCTYSCPSRPSGAQIYYDLGHFCHKNRNPSEYTPEQWRTIMLHMRVLQPMTACNHRMVLSFLQEKRPNLPQHPELTHEDGDKTAQNGDSLSDIVGPVSEASHEIFPTAFAGYASKFNFVFTGFIAAAYQHPFDARAFGDYNGNNSFGYIFEPFFLVSYSDNLLMASRIAIYNVQQSARFELIYSYVAYVYNDYITFQGGKFIIPF
jgi:hypothetical protein